jgi:drug/metabolite transporter (DMT)-like permease
MKYVAIYLTGTFVSAASQILLKLSATQKHKGIIAEYLNVKVVSAYIFFFGATLCTVFSYRWMPLSWGAILDSFGYFFITILSILFLKERLTIKKVSGMIVIILGVILYAQ